MSIFFTSFAGDISNNKRLEDRVTEEKEERRKTEERLTRAQLDSDGRLRDVELAAEVRIREAIKKTRSEAEEDIRERLKSQDKRFADEIQVRDLNN